jgi:hypothetical protein
MQTHLGAIALIASAVVSMVAPFEANAQPEQHAPSKCFYTRDWNGWKASPDAKSIYIRVGVRDLYRLDFSHACSAALGGGVHLVTRVRGSSLICSPVDLDLKVSDSQGFATPCIVSGITPLSAGDAAALPKNLRP